MVMPKQPKFLAMAGILLPMLSSSVSVAERTRLGRNAPREPNDKNEDYTIPPDQQTGHDMNSQIIGLEFPVGRIGRYLRQGKYAERVHILAPVYLAVVLEYFCADILWLAANNGVRKGYVLPSEILEVIEKNQALNDLPGDALPNIDNVVARAGKNRFDETFSLYIYKVLKRVHPNESISKKGMSMMILLTNDIIERIATAAGRKPCATTCPHCRVVKLSKSSKLYFLLISLRMPQHKGPRQSAT